MSLQLSQLPSKGATERCPSVLLHVFLLLAFANPVIPAAACALPRSSPRFRRGGAHRTCRAYGSTVRAVSSLPVLSTPRMLQAPSPPSNPPQGMVRSSLRILEQHLRACMDTKKVSKRRTRQNDNERTALNPTVNRVTALICSHAHVTPEYRKVFLLIKKHVHGDVSASDLIRRVHAVLQASPAARRPQHH